MAHYTFAILAGDGIGPEVVAEGLKVLKAASEVFGFSYEAVDYAYGTQWWIDHGKGEILPNGAMEEMLAHSAVLLGAIGDPRAPVGLIEGGVIGKLRWDGDLYVNLRPITLYAEHLCPIKGKRPEDVNCVVVRENTEDLYPGVGGTLAQGLAQEVAASVAIYTRHGTERIIRYSFELARKLGRKKVTLVDKANAVRPQLIYQRLLDEIGAAEFPEIERDHAYIDAACMWMIKNPEWFDVVVTTNMFGDILTDVGAIVQGGLGIAASGNIHPGKAGMFEPIHGSAPKHAGKNVACPIATINAIAMMLDYVGEIAAAKLVEQALRLSLTDDRLPLSTREIRESDWSCAKEGDHVRDRFLALARQQKV